MKQEYHSLKKALCCLAKFNDWKLSRALHCTASSNETSKRMVLPSYHMVGDGREVLGETASFKKIFGNK